MDRDKTNKNLSDIIQPINRETVHRICSGQVVLSLAIAVKELVENSIDAGANIINIYLKEYGAEKIEVSDNGKGVAKENFEALTLKYYTSKIRQFDDLESITTLGFRGEALSSLCALSDLTVTTKHTDAEHATRISYDRNGHITDKSLCAREQGTTVSLQNLFSTLPVRRKEFIKNLKREFNKMCQLLHAYCLVSKGIKFICTNITSKGSKNVVVSTDGLHTVKENIINVFGTKQISSLIEVEMIKPEEALFNEFGIKYVEGDDLPFTFEFLISSVIHGSGRSATDRQFFYINSRPCEPSKIMKLVNQIYKQYNAAQYPFVYLNVLSKSCLVDVNVTPDKRQVFIEREKLLLATLKASLIDAFKAFPCTYKLQNLDLTENSTIGSFLMTDTPPKQRGLKRSITESSVKGGKILEMFKKRSKTENDKYIAKQNYDNLDRSVENLDCLLNVASTLCSSEEEDQEVAKEEEKTGLKYDHNKKRISTLKDTFPAISATNSTKDIVKKEEIKVVCPNTGNSNKPNDVKDVTKKENICESLEERASKDSDKSDITRERGLENKVESHQVVDVETCKEQIYKNDTRKKLKMELKLNVPDNFELSLDAPIIKTFKKTRILNTSFEDIKKSIEQHKNKKQEANDEIRVRFRSQINPESNKKAEEELEKQISKSDFKNMQVIGQFNLGFIIGRLRNDLFIIDQHATDEKYNFEQLQSNMVLGNQVLVNPKPLELTAGNECLLIENEEIFKQSGFTFKIDHSAPCTKKVLLTAVPLSKNFIFGKDDIDEMLFMLQDSNHTFCRPSRVRAMFASRACRKSVKIGEALSKIDMKKLISHMGDIEQPWNCPHGRPTMRHLLNLELLED